MTDPTPTRAEVERLANWQAAREAGTFVRWSDYAALRERAEAAEKERDEALEGERGYRRKNDDLHRSITAARRAEAAAWNDAIEAAALLADGISKEATKYTMPVMAMGAQKCRDDIRALRRAAHTEGEA